ncbi:MAG: hypothetical protein M3Z92_13370 [Bacteroidota bacterium]|nr:hypothetical protein [Bacteroidota bacterium]MDQ6889216.1 hypothetical protein [Bacteroidota bacterium]
MIFLKNFLEPFSYLLYALLLFIVVDRNSSVKRKVLFIYYVIAVTLTYYASFLSYIKTHGDNNYLYNLFFFITICTFSYYFYNILIGRNKRYIVIFLFVLNLCLFIEYDIVLREFHYSYNNYVTATTYSSLAVYCLFYFDQLLRNVNEVNILHQFDFWLISGYLIYFLGAFFIILFYKDKNESQRAIIWAFQNIILFTSALIALTGNLWIKYYRKLQ